MENLARYPELIVDPTFDEFHAQRDSVRLAFLSSVAKLAVQASRIDFDYVTKGRR